MQGPHSPSNLVRKPMKLTQRLNKMFHLQLKKRKNNKNHRLCKEIDLLRIVNNGNIMIRLIKSKKSKVVST